MNKPRFGVWDTKDRCFIGLEQGPVIMQSMKTASVLADVVCIQFAEPGRFVARKIHPLEEFHTPPDDRWVEGKMTVEQAAKIKDTENKNYN